MPRIGDSRFSIQRYSLREQIAGAMLDEMMAGRLAAGRNFTVKEIAELYGVSATPAREALVDLAAQGLLHAEHHRGFTVPELTWRDFLEIFEARALLTDSAMRRLASWDGAIDWGRMPSLRRRADAAVRASRAGQLDVLVGCDRRFWMEAGRFLGNRRISSYLDWLRVQSWMFAAPYLRAADDLRGICWDRHDELADRIEARDLPGVHRLVNDYNLFTIELMASLARQPLDSVPVLALLRAPVGAPYPAIEPAEPPVGPPVAAGPTEVGLGLVPLPRFVPPQASGHHEAQGRFGFPLRPAQEQPTPGR